MKKIHELWNFCKIVAHNENRSVIILFVRYFFNFVIYGFSVRQYISLGVYKMKSKQKRTYVNYPRSKKIEKWFNDCASEREMLDNKAEFNKIFASYVKREYLDLSQCTIDDVDNFFLENKEGILKPAGLSSGKGIELVTDSGSVLSFLGKPYLLEQRMYNHEDIRRFSDKSLNTVRVYTLKTKDGKVLILSASLRIGTQGAIIDNMHGNGHAVGIDSQGKLFGVGRSYNSNIYPINPRTNITYDGIQLPHWDKVVECVNYSCSLLKHVRYNAWDIAILSDRVELIEGNVNPDPNLMQMFLDHGNYNVFAENR